SLRSNESLMLDADHTGDDAELDARRARRALDPEDLIAHRTRAGEHGAEEADRTTSPRPLPGDEYRRAIVYLEPPGRALAATGRGARDARTAQTLAPAGTLLAVVLAAPLTLSGGGAATVIVKVTGDEAALPEGTRLVGRP